MFNVNASYSNYNIERIEALSIEGGAQNYAKAIYEVVKLAINNLRDCGLHTYYSFASVPLAWKERKLSIASNHALRAFQNSMQFFSNSVAVFVPIVAVAVAKNIGSTNVWNVQSPKGPMGKITFWFKRIRSFSGDFALQKSYPQAFLVLKAGMALAAIGMSGAFVHQAFLNSSIEPSNVGDTTLTSLILNKYIDSLVCSTILICAIFVAIFPCMKTKTAKTEGIIDDKRQKQVEALEEDERLKQIETLKEEICELDKHLKKDISTDIELIKIKKELWQIESRIFKAKFEQNKCTYDIEKMLEAKNEEHKANFKRVNRYYNFSRSYCPSIEIELLETDDE